MLIDNGFVLHGWDRKNWKKNQVFIVSVGCGSLFCQGMNWFGNKWSITLGMKHWEREKK